MRHENYLADKDSYKSNESIDNSINEKREQEWLEENKEAIEKQNERMEREGSFSDEHRRF
jgi:post-segregation antitoxin (ccd killing protein)